MLHEKNSQAARPAAVIAQESVMLKIWTIHHLTYKEGLLLELCLLRCHKARFSTLEAVYGRGGESRIHRWIPLGPEGMLCESYLQRVRKTKPGHEVPWGLPHSRTWFKIPAWGQERQDDAIGESYLQSSLGFVSQSHSYPVMTWPTPHSTFTVQPPALAQSFQEDLLVSS